MSIVLRIRQQGIVRTGGYQVTQWAVTEPVVDPPGSAPAATSPLSYAPLFLAQSFADGPETLVGIATLQDLIAYPQNELKFFEPRGAQSDLAMQAALTGDVIRFPSERLDYWLLDSSPYLNRDFVVNSVITRSQGTSPVILPGSKLQMPGYNLTQQDVGRAVLLSGFPTSLYNGYATITGYEGNTATINKATSSSETGSTWAFRRLEIVTAMGPGVEPRFFPTKVANAAWELRRGNTVLASNSVGGYTARELPLSTSRTQRFTSLSPTLNGALDLMAVTRDGVAQLQRQAARNQTQFTTVITSTFGP